MIFTRKQIEKAIDIPYLIEELEKGLMLFSEKKAIVPPVGFIHLDKGDAHIKSGALIGDEFFVIKIATGFPENPKIGLPSSNGAMLLFSQKTGELKAVLLDEGSLTDLRTGLAGAICAKYLAPSPVKQIGIMGTGTQARMQLACLRFVIPCRDVMLWGRNYEKAQKFASDPQFADFTIRAVENKQELAKHCNLIVTATNSRGPLLFAKDLMPGAHITAVGADEAGKQELADDVLQSADLIVVDSLEQCREYGELSHAFNENILELGTLIKQPIKRPDSWLTVADLTGVAIEDVQIAKGVYQRLSRASSP